MRNTRKKTKGRAELPLCPNFTDSQRCDAGVKLVIEAAQQRLSQKFFIGWWRRQRGNRLAGLDSAELPRPIASATTARVDFG
ncbi:MAG: hypothetical protein ABSH15_08145, partial [Verrucomicrobiota bacterium]